MMFPPTATWTRAVGLRGPELYIETDLFAHNMAIAIALRYTLTVFMGIIINTGALYKSIASYSQF